MEVNELVVITKKELEDILYKYTRLSNEHLYKGLAKHVHCIEDQLRAIEETVEYLKLSLQTKSRGRKKKEVESS